MAEAPFELAIERTIAAPPEKVWDIMTNRLEEWWVPQPWRGEVDKIDWSAGGAFDTTMKGPDGEEFSGSGIFLEVTPNQRFVFTDAISSDHMPQDAFMIGTFELAPDGQGGTRYRAAARACRSASRPALRGVPGGRDLAGLRRHRSTLGGASARLVVGPRRRHRVRAGPRRPAGHPAEAKS